MKPGYLFIGNSSKPTEKQANSTALLQLGNVAKLPALAAMKHGYQVFMGINRNYPEKIVCQDFPVTFYDQHTYRNIFAIKDNYIAYKNLCALLKAHPEISLLHCNTPIGGFVGRLAGHKYKVDRIVYTAHGFHFYKGAPLLYRTVIKWIEKWLAHYTDAIITMNGEDYQSAKTFKLRGKGKVYTISGVGVDTNVYYKPNVDKDAIRKSIGIPSDAMLGIAMGDIVPRKNYKTAIEAVAKSNNPNVHYIICGRGPQIEELEALSKKLGVSDRVHFLGFRTDIVELANASDFFLFCSHQEGLPRSMMEAMSAGLPCIVSKIRGHVDLIEDNAGGWLISPNDSDGFAKAINALYDNPQLHVSFKEYNLKRIKKFDTTVVLKEFDEIFDDFLSE